MPEKVIFDQRYRGKSLISGFQSYVEPIIKYKPGHLVGTPPPNNESEECGPGTNYPMLVTANQLFEMCYRVNNLDIISGGLNGSYADTESASRQATFDISISGTDSAAQADKRSVIELLGFPETSSGFPAGSPQPGWREKGASFNDIANTSDPLISRNAFELNAGTPLYDPGNGSQAWDARSEITTWLGYNRQFDRIRLPLGINWQFRDDRYFSDFTSGTSFGPWPVPTYKHVKRDITETRTFSNGFVQTVYNAPTSPTIFELSERAVFIDNQGTGNPFTNGNQIYLGLEFEVLGYRRQDVISALAPDSNEILITNASNLIINLSNGSQVSCPLYYKYRPTNYPGTATFSVSSTNDWVFSALEWWEYSDQNGNALFGLNSGLIL